MMKEKKETAMFTAPFKFNLVYVYKIDDKNHKGMLKVGGTSFESNADVSELTPNCKELNEAARKRIDEQTGTAGIEYELLYTELAVRQSQEGCKPFFDKHVHWVLANSGYHRAKIKNTSATEWFHVDLPTVKAAIAAVKEFRTNIASGGKEDDKEIVFREEQEDAIAKTIKVFRKKNRMLWNAKMRFGKTLTAFELAKRQEKKFRRVLIATHRPVVKNGWQEDFNKLFATHKGFEFFIKNSLSDKYECDSNIERENDRRLKKLDSDGANFFYFASIQDLRGSKLVGGQYDKNRGVFAMEWDLVIIDEAHEGTQTTLGQEVYKQLIKAKTKALSLSGTPFNIIDQYDVDDVFVWDYVMEQRAKENWSKLHPDKPNPYAELPTLNIYTYDLGKDLKWELYEEDLEGKAFNFREFFKTRQKDGTFFYEKEVRKFLDLLSEDNKDNNYPFSTQKRRDLFAHTLWVIPGVAAAKALSAMLRTHPHFKDSVVVNVAGDGDVDTVAGSDALDKVKKAIRENERTITLSCGRLTTGVTVREWTAVLMLAGQANTSASQYMQTIFRVQSPATINGRMKTDCYAFDFAPDRVLSVLTTAARSNTSLSGNDGRAGLGEFLNFCPVLALSGATMQSYSVEKMMGAIKRIQVAKAIRNGFGDDSIYSKKLLSLGKLDLKRFENLYNIVGSSNQAKKMESVELARNNLDKEEYERNNAGDVHEPTEEEKKRREERRKKLELRKKAISILRAISIRMPLLIYGANVPLSEDINIGNFADLVDDVSWQEFMPQGVSKKLFAQYIEYYDQDVFREAARKIRALANSLDCEKPTTRLRRIIEIFGCFQNPDKETVLTPWRVVNMHLSATIGGYCFFDETFKEKQDEWHEPRNTEVSGVTSEVFRTDARILEINSKSGLYPLYVAYSIYRTKLGSVNEESITAKECTRIWNSVLSENLFVLCKTPMAVAITKRTLVGYTNAAVNTLYIPELLETLKANPEQLRKSILKPRTWRMKKNNMKTLLFDAVVGNPPYQVQPENRGDRASPVYDKFYDLAFSLSDRVTLITPGRFLFNAGQTPKAWNEKMLSDEHLKVVLYKQKSDELFPTVDIKGGVAITWRDANKTFGKIGVFTVFPQLNSILRKVQALHEDTLDNIVSAQGVFRFSKELYQEHPEAEAGVGKGTGNKIVSRTFETLPDIFLAEKPKFGDYIEMVGRLDGRRVSRFIKKSYLEDNPYINKFKVLVPEANGTGAIGEILSTPIIGTPMIGFTDTFIAVGPFATQTEADNCIKYVKTKFARTMLGVLKITQHNTKETWRCVPSQDFTELWTDEKLYKKYGLSAAERKFIEEMIKPMQ